MDDEARHEMVLAKAVLKTETENLIREAFADLVAPCFASDRHAEETSGDGFQGKTSIDYLIALKEFLSMF